MSDNTPSLSIKFNPYGKKYRRMVLTTIDTLTALLKDYCGDIPADAIPVKFMMSPEHKGKLAILMESADFPDVTPIDVRFNFKRITPVA